MRCAVGCMLCVYLVSPNQAIQDPRSKIIFCILKPEIRSRILGSKIEICVCRHRKKNEETQLLKTDNWQRGVQT